MSLQQMIGLYTPITPSPGPWDSFALAELDRSYIVLHSWLHGFLWSAAHSLVYIVIKRIERIVS